MARETYSTYFIRGKKKYIHLIYCITKEGGVSIQWGAYKAHHKGTKGNPN